MTEDIRQIDQEIETLKKATKRPTSVGTGASGYNVTVTVLTDLLGCIFIGCAIGFCCQFFWGTSVLLTAGLTLLGGIAGLYTTARYAMRLEKKDKP